MEPINALEVLKSFSKNEIKYLVDFLNRNHWVSDEDNVGLSSVMMEKWTKECDKFLEENGYLGGTLTFIAKCTAAP